MVIRAASWCRRERLVFTLPITFLPWRPWGQRHLHGAVITLGLSDSGFLPALLPQCFVCLVIWENVLPHNLIWPGTDQAGLELASVLLLPPESAITAMCYHAQITWTFLVLRSAQLLRFHLAPKSLEHIRNRIFLLTFKVMVSVLSIWFALKILYRDNSVLSQV